MTEEQKKKNSAAEERRIKANKKLRAQTTAAGEWFKQSAWLQVLLIVGAVIGVVVAIPYIVKCASDKTETSNFYKSKQINFSKGSNSLTSILNGEVPNSAGIVGDGIKGSETYSEDLEGFVVMYYKMNDDNCKTEQIHLQHAFETMSGTKKIKGQLKFYTVNVAWTPNDEDNMATNEGVPGKYDNSYITLEEQEIVFQSIKSTYLAQDTMYLNSNVTSNSFNDKFDSTTSGSLHTLPTPCFCLYTKKKSETKYAGLDKPTKVIFNSVSSLSNSADDAVMTQLYDIYNIKLYQE